MRVVRFRSFEAPHSGSKQCVGMRPPAFLHTLTPGYPHLASIMLGARGGAITWVNIMTQILCFVWDQVRLLFSGMLVRSPTGARAACALMLYHKLQTVSFCFPSRLIPWPFFFLSLVLENFDPGSRSRQISPLPTTVHVALVFIANNISRDLSFPPCRLASNCPYLRYNMYTCILVPRRPGMRLLDPPQSCCYLNIY